MKKLLSRWYLVITAGFLLFALLVFGICGEDSIIAIHDNLDLFVPQYQMMKDTGTFFSHNASVPFLGGISRDVLPSEFSLYTILYMILPAYPAYVAGYLIKILVALFSCILLAKDFCGDSYAKYRPIAWLCALSYGVLNVFPNFGIPFASIPLVVYLLRRIYHGAEFKKILPFYVALFFYPFVSYFSYFGLFILAYMAVAFIWLWIRDRKFPARILLAILILSVGCILFEYRLFGTMLFGQEETIRSTMEAGSMSAGEILFMIIDSFLKGMFHTESMHTYLVLPVCMIYFFYLNGSYLVQKKGKAIFHDVYNLLMLVLLFNSVIYGIYYWEGFRKLVETICPPLTGWQFNRTIFFSPFIWYAAFFLVLKRLYDNGKQILKGAANLLSVAAVLIIVLGGGRYNDLYHTCYSKAYELLKGQKTDQLSFAEFYSEELFEKAKEDIDYEGQWSAAYGFYPATLEYNGIATLDGYLGFYSQLYKEEFRKMIAPALDRVEASREYFDTWGARAYLYSGTDLSIVNGTRSYEITDRNLYLDVDAFKALGGRYIFSRIELENAQEIGLTLEGIYTHESSPYTLYVYRTTSRYQTKEHSDLSYEERKETSYDKELLKTQIKTLLELAQEDSDEHQDEVREAYELLVEELRKLSTANAMAEITYDQDVLSEEAAEKKEQTVADIVECSDEAYISLREIAKSPYRKVLEEYLDPSYVDALAEYVEETDREKEIALKENSLEQEYAQAAQEEYSFEYQGEEWTVQRFTQEMDSLSQEDTAAIYQGLNKERNAVLGEIYLELVALRNEEAQINGYDNYAEYAYENLYIRDYTLKDAKDLFREIRKEVVPVLTDIREYLTEEGAKYQEIYNSQITVDQNDIFPAIRPYLEQVDPELTEAMDHMLSCGLYDVEEGTYKAQVGFTTDLNYYGDAFIFLDPDGTYYDYTVSVHEFGHYNRFYHNTEGLLEQGNNVDLSEIHSQGLEVLLADRMGQIVSKETLEEADYSREELNEAITLMQLYDVAGALTQVALNSDFEIQVYENPEMSLEEMAKLYYNLSAKYGFYYVSKITSLYDWSEVPHLYNSPCYYISYLTSALSSLDLFTLSGEDRHAAVETYMELTTLPSYVPYCSGIESVGLRDVFEKGVPGDIVTETAEMMGIYAH